MAGMRLIRGLSTPFVAFPARVAFASHMFRADVAWARFCFTFGRRSEISLLLGGSSGTRLEGAR
ncbi:exported hypothetical protein [Mesorhizobium sp. ORS 3324]|nr:exported hypothetical protein [Mesorhizobium sp. ORS 3324]